MNAATPATAAPAAMSSQKWLAVAITVNQTQTGQASHSTFPGRQRTTEAITTPTMSASAAWSEGIAAYGFAAAAIAALEWLIDEKSARVSTKPTSGNIRGGAVGSRT